MSKPIIRVENLSKEYIISHRQDRNRGRQYNTLREVMSEKTRVFFHRFSPWTRTSWSKHGTPWSDPQPSGRESFWALQDVSFQVEQGEKVGIIGRNGAGKSTLLKLLSRITEPTKGRMYINGRVASLLEVGTGFHPELTGRENIYLNGAILGMARSEVRRKFDEIVEFAEVQRFLDTPVKRYSSGMYVRLAFSIAAHLETEILLVDEVLAVGDAAFQKKCIGKMEAVGRNGKTVLFVSHHMQTIEHLCSRAIWIEKGEIALDGQTKKVVSCYLNSIADPRSRVSLKRRSDRTGSGRYRFSDVWMTDSEGRRVNGLHTNEPAFIRALIEPAGEEKSMTAYASLCVRDLGGFRLFTLASAWKNIKVELRGRTEVCWKIDRLPLLENDFRCDLFLAEGIGGSGVIDYLLDAFLFPVFPADFLGTGRGQVKGLDQLYVDFDISWQRV